MEILKSISSKTVISSNMDLLELADLTAGFTGADIKGLFTSAQIKAIDTLQNEKGAYKYFTLKIVLLLKGIKLIFRYWVPGIL